MGHDNLLHGGLQVIGLRKQFSQYSLGAEFSVAAHERVALLGKSGCGKTTLLRILSGLIPMGGSGDAGEIRLGDSKITSLPPQGRCVGFVFQDLALFENLSVFDNIIFGLKMLGKPRKELESEAVLWLGKVGMQDRIASPVSILSGGERQRVAFIRALIWKPRLILLDEPFSALDRELRKRIRQELLMLHQLWPAPLILVSHDESDVEEIATSRMNMIWDGAQTSSRQVVRD